MFGCALYGELHKNLCHEENQLLFPPSVLDVLSCRFVIGRFSSVLHATGLISLNVRCRSVIDLPPLPLPLVCNVPPKMRDAVSVRRGEKIVVLCADKLAAPDPGATAPEHMVAWMRAETSAHTSAAGVPTRVQTPPLALLPCDVHTSNGHASPGLPKFLFEYEAPSEVCRVHCCVSLG